MNKFNEHISKIIEKQFEDAAKAEEIKQKRDGIIQKFIEEKFEKDMKNVEIRMKIDDSWK